MTSKTSCFDPAIFRRSLRKTLPLWACYLLVWLFILPGTLLTFDYNPERYRSISGVICEMILNTCNASVVLSAIIGLLAAWVLFSWLFRTGSSYFYASLPVRREALFVTNCSVGLLMAAGAHAIIALISFLITAMHGYAQPAACLSFFGISTLSFICFYGFAVLLSIIIAQPAAMPAVYVILNFTAVLLYSAVKGLLINFVYGMTDWWTVWDATPLAYRLSPIYYVLSYGLSTQYALLPDGTPDYSHYTFGDWGYLAAMAAAGLVFAALALVLFRRREMERSGDVIAVKFLRPVFLYCFTIGCSIVFAFVLTSLQMSTLYGARAFRRTLLFLVLGAAIGYFLAQMLLRKTLAVFRGAKTWVGLGAVCLVLVLGCTAARLDIFGVYSRVPDAADISYIDLAYYGLTSDPSDFESITQFQELLIEHRRNNEVDNNENRTSAYISYHLKDGTIRNYGYRLSAEPAQLENPDSLVRRFDAVVNSESMILSRSAIPEAFAQDERFFALCTIGDEYTAASGETPLPRYLTGKEAFDFYTNCILPDLLDTDLGIDHVASQTKQDDLNTIIIPVSFTLKPTQDAIDRFTAAQPDTEGSRTSSYSTYYTYQITKDVRRSAAFLESLGYSFDGPLG